MFGRPFPDAIQGVPQGPRRAQAGQAIDVRDPLAARLRSIADQAGMAAERLAPALLDVREIFGDLGADPRFRNGVTETLERIIAKGARAACDA